MSHGWQADFSTHHVSDPMHGRVSMLQGPRPCAPQIEEECRKRARGEAELPGGGLCLRQKAGKYCHVIDSSPSRTAAQVLLICFLLLGSQHLLTVGTNLI